MDAEQNPTHPSNGNAHDLALFTDLYELTMLQAYFEEGLTQPAAFSLAVRTLPPGRNFLLACGIDELLGQLERLRFEARHLDYLASLGLFREAFLDRLARLRFTGEVYAVAEGTPVFADEPILEVVAPLPEAQLIETLVINQVHLATVLASKAVRVVRAAAGRPVMDFGARRMHGIDAAVQGARAQYIAGVAATSNLLAGRRYGIPVAGTMAHSYIQAHGDERGAFAAFARLYPETVLLVDTYDTLAGIDRVIALAQRLGAAFRVRAVRLDSGDLVALAKAARTRLDAAGLERVQIIASGGLDEDSVAATLAAGAPVDRFGVGTRMGVARDAPDLDMAYKLCEYAGEGRLKLSTGKPVLPGRKQVFRVEEDGRDVRDVIARADEPLPGRPLLEPVMRGGRRTQAAAPLTALRERARQRIARLPDAVQANAPAEPPYPVAVSAALRAYQDAVRKAIAG
ncbi:nicotinate phosphoribosyltransferase [Ectothiorhodospiraceae bacterium 2226]|nr:nicotinate phosphoribosyltransferase [Ectothiorhodospiraceae bacterium 2226]